MRILCTLLTLCFSAFPFASEFSDVINSVKPSVIQVEAYPKPSLVKDKSFKANGIQYGTGFVVRDTIVVTSYHVVANTHIIRIRPYNANYTVSAKLIGFDKFKDIALLRIRNKIADPVTFSETEAELGDDVFAIGHPFGYENTVTKGIISHLNRRDPNYNFVRYIQTDVAINKGNSGGPLFNMKGHVVGIIHAIFSSTGGSDGVGFVLPLINMYESMARILEEGEVKRTSVGLIFEYIDPRQPDNILYDQTGLVITTILDNSPADKSDLKIDDYIIAVNDTKIRDTFTFIDHTQRYRPGDTINITVIRDGVKLIIPLILGSITE